MCERRWIRQIFQALQAQGGIVRRNKSDVWYFASEQELIQAVKDRGFHLVRNADQYIVICNSGDQ